MEKQKVLQILVNLVKNAADALGENSKEPRGITLLTTLEEGNRVKISVRDNGIGISQENLTRIFAHGFTTKKTGHGFGLHTGALAAKEMGGALIAQSDGHGTGATFILELPFAPAGEDHA